MAIKKEGFKRLRKKQEEERSVRVFSEVLKHDSNTRKKKKKRTNKVSYIDIRVSYNLPVVREKEKWVCNSYNPEKQKLDYIKWCYCKYYVPQFMFSLFFEKHHYFQHYFSLFLNWFSILANGESFYKRTKDYFTKKEAHVFSNINNNESIIYNFWYAKCKAIELDKQLTYAICKRSENIDIQSKKWCEVIQFIKKIENDINKNEFGLLLDFLCFYVGQNDFSLKGRTASSIIKMSNDWHLDQQRIKNNKYLDMSWNGLNIPNWKYTDKNNIIWTIIQLKNAKELQKEGNAMRHCVGNYAPRCQKGECSIFSLRQYDIVGQCERVATIEVLNKTFDVVQVRGYCNKMLRPDEDKIVKKWISKYNLKNSRMF